jgi:hypothetical protein
MPPESPPALFGDKSDGDVLSDTTIDSAASGALVVVVEVLVGDTVVAVVDVVVVVDGDDDDEDAEEDAEEDADVTGTASAGNLKPCSVALTRAADAASAYSTNPMTRRVRSVRRRAVTKPVTCSNTAANERSVT